MCEVVNPFSVSDFSVSLQLKGEPVFLYQACTGPSMGRTPTLYFDVLCILHNNVSGQGLSSVEDILVQLNVEFCHAIHDIIMN